MAKAEVCKEKVGIGGNGCKTLLFAKLFLLIKQIAFSAIDLSCALKLSFCGARTKEKLNTKQTIFVSK